MLNVLSTIIIVYFIGCMFTMVVVLIVNKEGVKEQYKNWSVTGFIFYFMLFWWIYWLGVLYGIIEDKKRNN